MNEVWVLHAMHYSANWENPVVQIGRGYEDEPWRLESFWQLSRLARWFIFRAIHRSPGRVLPIDEIRNFPFGAFLGCSKKTQSEVKAFLTNLRKNYP